MGDHRHKDSLNKCLATLWDHRLEETDVVKLPSLNSLIDCRRCFVNPIRFCSVLDVDYLSILLSFTHLFRWSHASALSRSEWVQLGFISADISLLDQWFVSRCGVSQWNSPGLLKHWKWNPYIIMIHCKLNTQGAVVAPTHLKKDKRWTAYFHAN